MGKGQISINMKPYYRSTTVYIPVGIYGKIKKFDELFMKYPAD